MEQEDRIFYIAIIVACIVGIAIVANSIVSSPKYEEHYTELYFYGEKIYDGAELEQWEGYGIRFEEDAIFIVSGTEELGPFVIGDTLEHNGVHWNIEDASAETGEVLLRAVPTVAVPGEDITFAVVIENHRGADLTYGCSVSTAVGEKDYSFAVKDKGLVQELVTVNVPAPPVGEEPIGEYDEVFQTYVRHVVDYGEFKHVTVEDEQGVREPYWRTRITVTLQTGNTIYFWIRLDDE